MKRCASMSAAAKIQSKKGGGDGGRERELLGHRLQIIPAPAVALYIVLATLKQLNHFHAFSLL